MLTGFFSFWFLMLASGQNQHLADSLSRIYNSGSHKKNDLPLLRDIAVNETDPNKKLTTAETLISYSTADSSFEFLRDGYLQKGNALRVKSDLSKALEAYFISIRYAAKINDTRKIGQLTISIADTYSETGNTKNAEQYYNQGISILRTVNDSTSLATALLNAGDEYFNTGKYDSALIFFSESGIIFKKKNSKIGLAYNLGNLGMVYAQQGKDKLAATRINEAIVMLEQLEDYYPISVYLNYMADIYWRKSERAEALSYAERSLNLSTRYGLKERISEANLKLSEFYDQMGDTKKSLTFYKNYILYRDSVTNIKSVEDMANMRTNFEVSKKQVEVDLLNQQKKNQRIVIVASLLAFAVILITAIGLYRRYKFVRETNRIIDEEKQKSDNLLMNILPQETAEELKNNGFVKVRKIESATVLFTDFKGFTNLAEKAEPELLVKSIDYYFREFDKITTKYGLEKIKTIGDSYMCAGGVPVESENHALHTVKAALEIASFSLNTSGIPKDLLRFEIRIGIHTGPVVTGVVGMKKFQYDIWGDTVNIASRMESSSQPGRVNISDSTFQIVKNEFNCSYRGELDVKNKGMLKMYFVGGS